MLILNIGHTRRPTYSDSPGRHKAGAMLEQSGGAPRELPRLLSFIIPSQGLNGLVMLCAMAGTSISAEEPGATRGALRRQSTYLFNGQAPLQPRLWDP
ncbi:hypothetical protein EYF80_019170 [Liparis tanakae]|uniref:Uncharacterized protein n=1 Tax=Liparis tanakae TaxID=230148 RepID=A0A4Z2HXJ3_9TELE|nr:hypothetical protein EYF80_019170 [Liparis tanakae]